MLLLGVRSEVNGEHSHETFTTKFTSIRLSVRLSIFVLVTCLLNITFSTMLFSENAFVCLYVSENSGFILIFYCSLINSVCGKL
jgi:hypothetical protein